MLEMGAIAVITVLTFVVAILIAPKRAAWLVSNESDAKRSPVTPRIWK